MIKIDRCKKAKMLRKLKAFGSAKRNRTVRHRCEVTVSKEQLAKMFYDKEKMEKNIEKTTIKIQ
ncbi:hypothetical protein [[Ruminococcus] lactaris]|uniref:hypothetical protein n=1 Tax=[Ruminococcus] lactaris TaxID=46228 RepID=UPI00241CB68F|nr:hypothetical protein [[Ruminococcus] lactaris]